MILVTGAAGKTGQAIIRTLVAEGQTVRALIRRTEQTQAVTECGANETVVADMRDEVAFNQAAQGAQAIYHICANVNPHEVEIGRNAISAARAAGIKHFVYHSVLHPQTQAMPHHWQKLRVEEMLFESHLPFTIIQPAAYMQNVLAHWDEIVERGVYTIPYPVETRLGMVDLEDVAKVAAIVLTEPGHMGAIYELAGPEALTQTQVAEILSRVLGRTVQATTITIDAWQRQAQASGLGNYQIETLVKMFRYYEHFGFWGNPRVLAYLIGRTPTSFEDFVNRTAIEFML